MKYIPKDIHINNYHMLLWKPSHHWLMVLNAEAVYDWKSKQIVLIFQIVSIFCLAPWHLCPLRVNQFLIDGHCDDYIVNTVCMK